MVGTLFFGFYYENSFSFYINGNGGFIGNYLNKTFLVNIISPYESIFYYFFLLLLLALFLKSLNFSIKDFFDFLKNINKLLFKKKEIRSDRAIIVQKILLKKYLIR